MTDSQCTVSASDLKTADLLVDATYQGGRAGNSGDDPLNALLKVSLMGGFRYRGSLSALEVVVLTSTMNDPDWPDTIDRETGVFTYYGDNKRPGRALHDTPRHGNEILRNLFDMAHGGVDQRRKLPPILVFASTGVWRDMFFVGLAIPGTSDLRVSEDLAAIWKIADGRRFQNYRARFTILDVPIVSRAWIHDIIACDPHSSNMPTLWKAWVEHGEKRPLLATRSLEHRRKAEQLPPTEDGRAIIKLIHEWFSDRANDFEHCAAEITRLMLPDVAALDVTRPSRDGGRDAVGQLRIGKGAASILIDFAIEAKCYALTNAVGVREVSRLISRLRHRQFGILVTTSYLDAQAYREIKEDQHPIIVLAAVDIVEVLRANGRAGINSIREWLAQEYPKPL
jgi:Restriction endonuclease AspBHI N-terminal/Restriction endonuclease